MLQRARGLHFIRRGSVVGRTVISLLVSRPSEVAVKARHVSRFRRIQSLADEKWFIATSVVSANSGLVCLLYWISLTHLLSAPDELCE